MGQCNKQLVLRVLSVPLFLFSASSAFFGSSLHRTAKTSFQILRFFFKTSYWLQRSNTRIKVLLRIGTFGKAIIEVFNSTVNTPESRAEGKLVPILGAGQ
jgi:hypothetical protein